MIPNTSEGYVWTAESGVVQGSLPCKGVIQPPTSIRNSCGVYDCIVIGAGFAGLTAARDLALAKRKVLLIEARDRIGGRTYSIEKDGYTYEMGGTWVSHFQPNLFREMQRYDMDRDLVTTRQGMYENNYYTMNLTGDARKLAHEEAGKLQAKAWDLFVNVDGAGCRKICPLPHQQLGNVMVKREDIERVDAMSCRERFEQIKDQLTEEESALLLSLILHISGGNLDNSSLWDMIRSHALAAHSSDNFEDVWLLYKLREGQSTLAKRMLDEAVNDGLDYAFSTEVASISDWGQQVEVTTPSGERFRASQVISTIPLNVLCHIRFEPPLSPLRQEALNIGHVNFMNKIHAEVKGSGLASWNGMSFPNILMYGYGDGVLNNGNAHIVGFGTDERATGYVAEKCPEQTIEAFQKLHPMKVEKMIFHNWNTDPYSQGGPAWWAPGYMSRFQAELQSPHGNVRFASADWAHGWRAFIDGAIEQGHLNAKAVLSSLGPISARTLSQL
ncbi:Amine oxidase [Fusarium sp. LHS14.1]|nr:Amine oxidase [Fusarium sp. LHS14.1]